MKNMRLNNSLPSLSIGLCLAVALVSNQSRAASQYFGVTGGITNGGTYSWDAANWGNSSTGPFTSAWINGNLAGFYAGNGGSGGYTVEVNASESVSGMYLNSPNELVTINDAGSGTGSLNIVSGYQGFIVGLLGENLVINVPLSGSGGVSPEGNGYLYLFGNNSYTGGTEFRFSGAPGTFYNNNNSFGTGPIVDAMAAGNYASLLATGDSTITLANAFQNTVNGAGFNFDSRGAVPVVSTGNWSLGTNNLNLRNSGDSTAPLKISGVISGTAGLSLSANNYGTIILSGANTYTGFTTVGVGASPVTLMLGAANTISSSSSIILAGGILNPGGFNQAMSGTLVVATNSTIDFGAGNSTISFADSHSVSWTSGAILNLANWTGFGGETGPDELQFGTSASGLTAAQLADIEIDGNAASLGTATLDANGYLVVPEPSTLTLGLLGGLSVMRLARRRKA